MLRQGLKRQHLFVVFALCALLDTLLINLGALGFGKLVSQHQNLKLLLSYTGMAFLIYYGVRSMQASILSRADIHIGRMALNARQVVMALLAVSLLNPSVYFDNLVVIGAAAAHYQDNLRTAFVMGAVLASVVWFFALSYGAALVAPLFRHQATLRVVDAVSGLAMFWMAARLIHIQM